MKATTQCWARWVSLVTCSLLSLAYVFILKKKKIKKRKSWSFHLLLLSWTEASNVRYCSLKNASRLYLLAHHEVLSIPKYSWVKCDVIQHDKNPKHISKFIREWKRKESKRCGGPVKIQTSNWLKRCGESLREVWMS